MATVMAAFEHRAYLFTRTLPRHRHRTARPLHRLPSLPWAGVGSFSLPTRRLRGGAQATYTFVCGDDLRTLLSYSALPRSEHSAWHVTLRHHKHSRANYCLCRYVQNRACTRYPTTCLPHYTYTAHRRYMLSWWTREDTPQRPDMPPYRRADLALFQVPVTHCPLWRTWHYAI